MCERVDLAFCAKAEECCVSLAAARRELVVSIADDSINVHVLQIGGGWGRIRGRIFGRSRKGRAVDRIECGIVAGEDGIVRKKFVYSTDGDIFCGIERADLGKDGGLAGVVVNKADEAITVIDKDPIFRLCSVECSPRSGISEDLVEFVSGEDGRRVEGVDGQIVKLFV